jgi:hypothetical protein
MRSIPARIANLHKFPVSSLDSSTPRLVIFVFVGLGSQTAPKSLTGAKAPQKAPFSTRIFLAVDASP